MRSFIIGLLLAALGCLSATILTFNAVGMFGPVHRWVPLGGMILWLLVPFVTVYVCYRGGTYRTMNGLAALLAGATAFTIIADFMGRSGQGSFGDGLIFGPVFSGACLLLSAIVMGAGVKSSGLRYVSPVGLYALVLGGLILGWYVAMEQWSRATPPLILADARRVAGARAYCIETSHGEVRRLSDLRGFAVWSETHGQMQWDFHAVLKLSNGPDVQYFNWSHHARRFQIVSQYARAGLHLDKNIRCLPEPGFVDRLG